MFDRDREVEQCTSAVARPTSWTRSRSPRWWTCCAGTSPSPAAQDGLLDRAGSALHHPAEVGQLGRAGFNRASLGVQDFDPVVQEALNRIEGVEQTLGIIEGLPRTRLPLGQRGPDLRPAQADPGGLRAPWTSPWKARPDRLAIYGYAHLPNLFKPQHRIHAEDLPSPEVSWTCCDLAIDKLGGPATSTSAWTISPCPATSWPGPSAGGLPHRNFMGYTTHAESDWSAWG